MRLGTNQSLKRYDISLGQILVDYVNETVKDIDIDARESAQEERAVFVCRCIPKEDTLNRGRALLSLMRNTFPPYTEELEQLVSISLEEAKQSGDSVPLAEEIREQKRLMDLRNIVTKYSKEQSTSRIKFRFDKHSDATQLIEHVTAKAARESDKEKVKEMLQDAIQVSHSYHRIDSIEIFILYLENISQLKFTENNQDIIIERYGIARFLNKVNVLFQG